MDLNLLNYAPRNGIENGEGVGLLTLITMVKPGHLEEIVTLEDGGDLRQEITSPIYRTRSFIPWNSAGVA